MDDGGCKTKDGGGLFIPKAHNSTQPSVEMSINTANMKCVNTVEMNRHMCVRFKYISSY